MAGGNKELNAHVDLWAFVWQCGAITTTIMFYHITAVYQTLSSSFALA